PAAQLRLLDDDGGDRLLLDPAVRTEVDEKHPDGLGVHRPGAGLRLALRLVPLRRRLLAAAAVASGRASAGLLLSRRAAAAGARHVRRRPAGLLRRLYAPRLVRRARAA